MAPGGAKARRISYVVPPPATPAPRLLIPSLDAHQLGKTSPLLIYAPESHGRALQTPIAGRSEGSTNYFGSSKPSSSSVKNPQHRLGVTALALDTTTTLSGRPSPEGILYSGGRDGLIVAWEQGTPMRRRKQPYATRSSAYHWEDITGWDDGSDDEDEEEDTAGSAAASAEEIPYWDRWEPDYDALLGQPSHGAFRQCVQAHTDWINDIALCNLNRTVISASNDGTIKAWSPHSATLTPSVIGEHLDYVRCVTHSAHRNWIASGSFDRTVKLWDLEQPRADPITTLNLPDSPKASVYALATHPSGNLVAAGSPERVVRIWDLRSGKKVSKLVGHTDNIRALLLSDDGKYLLSGSSDATVRLWSVGSQRCLHTFSYHTDSVWSLSSNHPNLEIFYSGDRSGLVCKVDVEHVHDVSEGECAVVCREGENEGEEGVNKLIAMDDAYLWTATGSSSIRRWSLPRRRKDRQEKRGEASLMAPWIEQGGRTASPPPSLLSKTHQSRFSTQSTTSATTVGPQAQTGSLAIPYPSLVRLASARDLYAAAPAVTRENPEIATLYSAMSIRSVPNMPRPYTADSTSAAPSITSPNRSLAQSPDPHPDKEKDAYEVRELAIDAVPLRAAPDDVLEGTHGLVRSVLLNDRLHALTVDTAGEVALWDVARCVCLGVYSSEDVQNAASSNAGSSIGGSSAGNERSPREALETVRERIEGDAMCPAWATVDTKIGHLTVHLVESRCFDAEVYADEVGFKPGSGFPDDHKLNVGKWVLTNLFRDFVKAELESASSSKSPVIATIPETPSTPTPTAGLIRGAAPTHIRLPSSEGRRLRSTSDLSNVVHTPGQHAAMTPALPPESPPPLPKPASAISSGRATPDAKPQAAPHKATFLKESTLTPIPPTPSSLTANTTVAGSTPSRTPSTVGREPGDYFGGKGRTRSGSVAEAGPGQEDAGNHVPATPGGGFMGRLRNFGKSSKRPSSADASALAIQEDGKNGDGTKAAAEGNSDEPEVLSEHAKHLKALNAILSQQLQPTPEVEAPTVKIPDDVAVMISESAPDASGWSGIYSSLVSANALKSHVAQLEMSAPMWLLELLLLNKCGGPTPSKLGFIVVAYDRRHEPVDESSRLTAGRSLRVRKILYYIRDKLQPSPDGAVKSSASSKSVQDAKSPSSPAQVTASPPRTAEGSTAPKPEDQWEIVCNDVVVPLSMTIGAVRHYIWRQGNELTMYYRLKRTPLAAAS